MRGLLITFGFMLLATDAMACSYGPGSRWKDKPISVASDGSFKYAGDDDFYHKHFGGKIVDLGDQRVAQRITFTSPCAHDERLLFVDCRHAEVVAVIGVDVPVGILGAGANYIDLVQVPIGTINVRKITSVEELISIAFENDYRVSLNVEKGVAAMKSRNRYDPFNGCKIYYPESYGARG